MLFLIAHNTSTANRIKNGHFTYFRIFYTCSHRLRLNWLLPFDSASNFTPDLALGVFFNWPQQHTINWKDTKSPSSTTAAARTRPNILTRHPKMPLREVTTRKTRITYKRVLRSDQPAQLQLKRKKKPPFKPSHYSDSWYYTRDCQPSPQKYNDKFILLVGYYCQPERKAGKSNQRKKARTIDAKFNTVSNIPNFFDSPQHATFYATEFRRHVENIVRGERPRKTLQGKILHFTPENIQLHSAMKVTNLRRKKQILDAALKAALKLAFVRRSDWQKWRLQSISVLEHHLNNGTSCLLLREPPKDGMVVSQHVAETTLKKTMGLRLFLQLMYERDDVYDAALSSDTHASVLAERSGALLGLSKTFVYKAYKEWRDGQEAKVIERQKKNNNTINDSGWFEGEKRGAYERSFILHEEDLRVKFKCWMRKNLRKMSVDLSWEFINSKLLKKIPEETCNPYGRIISK